MRKKLLIKLLLTLFVSLIGTGLVFAIWYSSAKLGFEERQATAILLILLTVFQNLVTALFTLPILSQIDTSNYSNRWTKFSYLYIAPIIVTFLLLFYYLINISDKIVFAFIVAPTIFIFANSYFYRQLARTINVTD
jgi:hypothetical protein